MNATNLLTALLFAAACLSVNANDAPAKAASPAKAAETKSSEKAAAEAKQGDAKPAEDAKVAADTTVEAPAKPVSKKKKPVKKVVNKAKEAEAHTDVGHPAPDANADKILVYPDVRVSPVLAAIEPGKRSKLKKAFPGGTPVGVDTNAANSAPAPAPAPAPDFYALASTLASAAPAPAPVAAPLKASTSSASAAIASDHNLNNVQMAYAATSELEVSKRLKSNPPLPGETASSAADSPAPKADLSEALANDHAAAVDDHAVPKTAAAHDDHAPAAADANTPTAPAAAPAPVAAKALPAHTGHGPISLSTARAAAEECDLPLKSEIAALFDRWNNSLRTGDPRKVVANYAPNSILLPTVSNRARFTIAEKEEYFMHFLMRRPEGSIDDRMIEVDCNSATDAGLYTFRFADGTKVKARYSFSYKKVGSEWLITSHHSSAMPERSEPSVETHAANAVHAPAPVAAPAAKAVPGRPGDAPDASTKGWVRYP